MGLFRIKRTFSDPGASQSGMATPGAGAQGDGRPTYNNAISDSRPAPAPERPTKGVFSWLFDTPASRQRGYPAPENALQHRPPGSMPNRVPPFGDFHMVYTEPYSRGAAAYVPNTGKVLTNPIGAGIYAPHRPKPSYGPAAQFVNGIAFWANQVVPTTINLQGLTTPEEMQALLGNMNVEAAVRIG